MLENPGYSRSCGLPAGPYNRSFPNWEGGCPRRAPRTRARISHCRHCALQEWKFLIIKTLALHDEAETVFVRLTLGRLNRYLKEGIYFAGSEAAVAMEPGR